MDKQTRSKGILKEIYEETEIGIEDERDDPLQRLRGDLDKQMIDEGQKEKVQLSFKSKKMVILRVVILFLACIYLPLETVFSNKYNKIEKVLIFEKLDDFLPTSIRNSAWFIWLNSLMTIAFSSKDSIMIIVSVIYQTFHPFTAIKVVFVTNFMIYTIVILRCLYQNYRPYWNLSRKTSYNTFCPNSYASPPMHYFVICFFYIYLFLSIRLFRKSKKTKKMSLCKKFLILISFALVIVIFTFIYVITELNYIYQLNFTLTVSLIIICLLLDFESHIHNSILESLKNMYKIRKNKIRIFLFVLMLNLFSIFIYNFIEESSLNEVEMRLSDIKACHQFNLNNLGLRATFIEGTYSWGILGAFWGTALTVKYNTGQWWGISTKNSIIKSSVTVAVGIVYLLFFNFIQLQSFEFNYVTSIVKYLFFYYITMGWLPIIFKKLNMNKKINSDLLKRGQSLFASNLLSINSHGQVQNKKEGNKDEIFHKSILVGGVDPKTHRENLEFLVRNNENYNDNYNDNSLISKN